MKFRTPVITIGCVFLASLLLIGVAKRFEYVDVPLHLAGGIAWTMMAAWLIGQTKISHAPKWFYFLFTVGFVMTIGVGWEIYEFIARHVYQIPAYTLRDTLGDLMNDGYGAIIGWYFFIKNIR